MVKHKAYAREFGRCLKQRLLPFFKNIPLKEINRLKLNEFLTAMRKRV